MLRQGILEKQGTKLRHGMGPVTFLSHGYFHLDPVVWCDRRGGDTGKHVCAVFVWWEGIFPAVTSSGVFVPLNTKLLGTANHNVAPPTPADDAATTSNPLCIFRV